MEIAQRFEQQNQGVRVDVQTGGSSRGINDIRNRLADIGMVSRALKPDEGNLAAHTIAWEALP
jgi:phosphate transport system substrate-binding protein